MIEFTCYVHPEPQGSAKGFPIRRANGQMGVSITSSNKNLMPFRDAVARGALVRLNELNSLVPAASKHVPVVLEVDFFFNRPQSVPKKREYPVVKPDVDKLLRAICDALEGILYVQDAQVIDAHPRKFYGSPERVEIRAYFPTLETTEDNPKPMKYDKIPAEF